MPSNNVLVLLVFWLSVTSSFYSLIKLGHSEIYGNRDEAANRYDKHKKTFSETGSHETNIAAYVKIDLFSIIESQQMYLPH